MSGETECCPSCGVAYVEHLGLTGTCAEVLRLREAWITCQQDRHDMETRHQQEVELLREALELTLDENTELIRALEKISDMRLLNERTAGDMQDIAREALQRAGGDDR